MFISSRWAGGRGGGGIQTFPLLGPVSQKSHQRFGPENLFCVRHVRIHHQSFNNFENDTIKLSVNKAKLASLWARNCATIQQVLILKFSFGSEMFPGLSRNGPRTCHSQHCCLISLYFSRFPLFRSPSSRSFFSLLPYPSLPLPMNATWVCPIFLTDKTSLL